MGNNVSGKNLFSEEKDPRKRILKTLRYYSKEYSVPEIFEKELKNNVFYMAAFLVYIVDKNIEEYQSTKIKKYGYTPIHRKSYEPIKSMIKEEMRKKYEDHTLFG